VCQGDKNLPTYSDPQTILKPTALPSSFRTERSAKFLRFSADSVRDWTENERRHCSPVAIRHLPNIRPNFSHTATVWDFCGILQNVRPQCGLQGRLVAHTADCVLTAVGKFLLQAVDRSCSLVISKYSHTQEMRRLAARFLYPVCVSLFIFAFPCKHIRSAKLLSPPCRPAVTRHPARKNITFYMKVKFCVGREENLKV
jgi:hypothetical protein